MNEKAEYLLISAHHCAPGMGSEHAVGWNLASRLARRMPVLLVTQDNEFRPAVEEGVARLRAQGHKIEAFFVRHGATTSGLTNALRFGYYLSYIAYQWRVYRLAQALMARYRIRAVHHLTIVGFREPGFLWRLGLPFIWGPVGGLVYTPWALYREVTPKVRLFMALRAAMTAVQFRFSPRVRAAYHATQRPGGAFIAATPDIGRRFADRFGGQWHWISETGSAVAPPLQIASPGNGTGGVLRLLWVGALIDIKPLGMLLEAMARVPGHSSRLALTVVGDGEARPRFEAIAQRLGIQASFKGWCSHDEVQASYRLGELFVLLSAKDLTTNVVFEALGHGLPVMCLDHHGYSYIVDESCGIKVPVRSHEQICRDIAQQLSVLIDDPTRLAAMGRNALRRAAEFSWDENARRIGDLIDGRSSSIEA